MKHFVMDVDYWRAVVEAAGLGVWDYDIVTGEKNYSPRWCQMHGMTSEAQAPASDQDWFATLHPDDVATARHFTDLINSGTALDVAFEYRERNAEGGWTWFMCRGRAIYHDPKGRATRFVGIDTDITAMKMAEAAQIVAAKQLQDAVAIAGIGIWTYDLQSQTATWDARMKEIFGVQDQPNELPKDFWEQFLHPDDYDRVTKEIAAHNSAQDDFSLNYRIIRPDGELRHIRSRITFVADGLSGPSFVGVNWDATEEITYTSNLEAANAIAHQRLLDLTLAQHELEVLSTHDPLTGLANRRALDNHIATLGGADANLSGVAVMLFDLDHLKRINDRFGHAAGDAVLLGVAQALKTVVIPRGLVARTGGDEFVAVISTPLSVEDLRALANATSDAVARMTCADCPTPTVSIGAAHCLDRPESFIELHRRADNALYQAKHAGRSQTVIV